MRRGGEEGIEEEQASSNPLLVKESTHQSQGYCHGEGGGESGLPPSPATSLLVLSTLVAVSGSYVFGSAVSE